MRSLDKKLFRDFRRMWAQVLAIALVLASGIATLVLALGALRSLEETRAAYYDRHWFADVFAAVTRAPVSLTERLDEIPGVAVADTRISKLALLDIEGFPQPATGLFISLPDQGGQKLNRLYLRAGRLPEIGRVDEVVINEAFANAHRFKPGARVKAILNGRMRTLTVVGIALSPEFIYALGPGDLMPDDRRFGVFWMSREALGSLFDLDGAFNSLTLKLLPGASEAAVIDRVDRLLERYGGTGASGRKDQTSHAFLDAEMKQLTALARVMPPIFLLVTAFLINITLARLVALEREQIGLLKAIGYSPSTIAMHYVQFVLAIAAVGTLIGALAGTQLGRGLTRLYGDFFHFPFLIFKQDPAIYILAAAIAIVSAVAGALRVVLDVLRLPPAVAMHPPAPPRYRKLFKSRPHWLPPLSQTATMAVRNMLRWPLRSGFTLLGIALACGLMVTALLSFDAVDLMVDVAFNRMDRQHATIEFGEPNHTRATRAVAGLPGVMRTEPYRTAPVRLINGARSRQLSIVGLGESRDLSRVLDAEFRPVPLPETGIAISERVAEILDLRRGDMVTDRGHHRQAAGDAGAGDRGHQELFRARRVHAPHRSRRPARRRRARQRRALQLRQGTRERSVQGGQDHARHRGDRAQPDLARQVPRDHRAEHQLHGDDLYYAGGDHHLRRCLQQCPHPAVGARPGAGKPAGAWLHPRRGVLGAAVGARDPHRRGNSAGMAFRIRLRPDFDPVVLERPLPRTIRHRSRDLCSGGIDRDQCRRRLGAHRAAAGRSSRPGIRIEDTRLGMNA